MCPHKISLRPPLQYIVLTVDYSVFFLDFIPRKNKVNSSDLNKICIKTNDYTLFWLNKSSEPTHSELVDMR